MPGIGPALDKLAPKRLEQGRAMNALPEPEVAAADAEVAAARAEVEAARRAIEAAPEPEPEPPKLSLIHI